MRNFLFVLLSACMLFSACKKDSIQITKDKLVGTWAEVDPYVGPTDTVIFRSDNTVTTPLGEYTYAFITADSVLFTAIDFSSTERRGLHFDNLGYLHINLFQYQTPATSFNPSSITLKKL